MLSAPVTWYSTPPGRVRRRSASTKRSQSTETTNGTSPVLVCNSPQHLERLGKTAVVAQVDRLQAANRRHGLQQVPAVAVDVQHAAVIVTQNPFDGLPAPGFKIVHRRHVERIDAFGNDPAVDPLDHVAGGAAAQQSDTLEKRVLNQDVQLEGKVNRPPDEFGLFDQADVRIGRADQFEHEVQAVDQDEVADAELARGGRDERVQLGQVTLKPRRRTVDAQTIELGPVLQQRRDHRRDPAAVRVRHETDLAAEHPAVQPLVHFAQVRGGNRIVLQVGPRGEQPVPECDPRRRIGIRTLAVAVGPSELVQRRIRKLEGGENPVRRLPLVQLAQPSHDVAQHCVCIAS